MAAESIYNTLFDTRINILRKYSSHILVDKSNSQQLDEIEFLIMRFESSHRSESNANLQIW